MPQLLTNALKMRRLPWLIAADGANAIFCGLTIAGSVFLLFLYQLGLDKTRIGFLLSLFPFCGLSAIFLAPAVARIGVRRVFIACWLSRKLVIALLLALPWIPPGWRFPYTAVIIGLFALCRAVGETAYYPWSVEIIPVAVRGKFNAVQNVTAVLGVLISTLVVSRLLLRWESLNLFLALIALGVLFGILSVCFYSFVPGGAAAPEVRAGWDHLRSMGEVFSDSQFCRFMIGLTVIALGYSSFLSFGALFCKESLGLSSSQVLILDATFMAVSLVPYLAWGWVADRFGAKPVMVLCLLLLVGHPVGLLLAPRNSPLTFPILMLIVAFAGIVLPGWGVAFNRFFFVNLVPEKKKTAYTAVYYAWVGLVMGLGPLLVGVLIDAGKGAQGRVLGVHVDNYTPLLLAAAFSILLTAAIYSRLPSTGRVSPGRLAEMLILGNLIPAFRSVIAYHLAKQEPQRLSTVERLGQARSPLNVSELIDALRDPSFNIRHEAIIAAARTVPDDDLIDSLVEVVHSDDPDLAVTAAWALGRLGNRRAVGPLRLALVSHYPLLRARAARALASLEDQESVGCLLEQFRREDDCRLQVAYGAALGTLRCQEALPLLLELLERLESDSLRRELALAIAGVVGQDHRMVRLFRKDNEDASLATAGSLLASKRKLLRLQVDGARQQELDQGIELCLERLGGGQFALAAVDLVKFLEAMPYQQLPPTLSLLVQELSQRLPEQVAARRDYLLLTLYCLEMCGEALEELAEAGAHALPQRDPQAPLGSATSL